MKLPPLSYVGAASLDEAVRTLAQHGHDSAVLAGGQSLLIEMRYGDRTPAVLVGIDRVADLDQVTPGTEAVTVGATVRHADLEHGALGGGPVPTHPLDRLTRMVAPKVAHPPIRSRGTFVGSLAWGHPCAEWCALAVLVDASLQVLGADGARRVAAGSWFRGDRRTDRRPDELVTAVDLPLLPPAAGVGFVEHRRSHASFALVAGLAVVDVDDDGMVRQARVAVGGAADVPLRSVAAEESLRGRRPDAAAIQQAAQLAAGDSDPVDEPHCSAEYRRHAVAVVVARALDAAVQDVARSLVAA